MLDCIVSYGWTWEYDFDLYLKIGYGFIYNIFHIFLYVTDEGDGTSPLNLPQANSSDHDDDESGDSDFSDKGLLFYII